MADEVVNVGGQSAQPAPGSAGVATQVGGQPTTVSSVAGATGGIAPGNLVEVDIDQELYKFKSDDTPLMQLMLHAKKIKVSSPEVEHFMIDEPRSSMTTAQAVAAGTTPKFVLPVLAEDAQLAQPYGTLLVKGVDGYMEDGKTKTPGKDLMLFVTGHDDTTGNPIVRAVNGPKQQANDQFCTTPAIPAGTVLIILSNALYETQKEVNPDLIVPQSQIVYLQKRGMNQVVSDYFDAQKKRIPFSQSLIAEAAITNFKVRTNRTLYAGRKSKFTVTTDKVGVQNIYTTEGVRWQVKKEVKHSGKWTIEEFIGLAKFIFTGEDVPKSMICLCGKNFLENIQCIDFSKHPEIQINVKTNSLGWVITNIHTVFGDLEFKRDPTLDRLGYESSALVTNPERIVHYVYSAEHSSSDRVEGEEATRKSILAWDGMGLKGSCHYWINGESTDEGDSIDGERLHLHFYDGAEAPEDPKEGCAYYLISDCPGISTEAVKGTVWQYKESKWVEYSGFILAE